MHGTCIAHSVYLIESPQHCSLWMKKKEAPSPSSHIWETSACQIQQKNQRMKELKNDFLSYF